MMQNRHMKPVADVASRIGATHARFPRPARGITERGTNMPQYNPPPNWPPPPSGWTPPPGWQPDPAWGPPPPGWQTWIEDAPTYGPPIGYQPPAGPTRRNWFVRHKILTAVAALFVIGVVGSAFGGGGESGKPKTPVAGVASQAASRAPLSAPPVAPSAAAKVAPTSDAPAPPAPPAVKPVVYTGRGDRVLKLKRPGGQSEGAVLLYVKGNAARVNFIIESKTADGEDVDLLVNETDPFEGLVPIDFQDGQRTSRLVVKAGGPWRLEVRPLTSARRFDSAMSGRGSTVLYYTGDSGVATITGNKARTNFIMESYGVDSGEVDLLVNETDPYKGEIEWPANALIVVRATGAWSIKVS